ncbi:MAG: hypothetical protein EA398_15710 [Deltaproteobacteria bacterium]|nr:MAG: hypothetical protein EA398_15710 [Deltaproteobacteria bacterium]
MTTFREVVKEVPSIADAFEPGLRALHARDRARILAPEPRRLRGSVDLDEALRVDRPGENRWDYIIGLSAGEAERAIFVEVHPASTSDVATMLRKLQWLKEWLRGEGAALRALRDSRPYRWVASGKVVIRPGTPQARRLASSGLAFPVRELEL